MVILGEISLINLIPYGFKNFYIFPEEQNPLTTNQ